MSAVHQSRQIQIVSCFLSTSIFESYFEKFWWLTYLTDLIIPALLLDEMLLVFTFLFPGRRGQFVLISFRYVQFFEIFSDTRSAGSEHVRIDSSFCAVALGLPAECI